MTAAHSSRIRSARPAARSASSTAAVDGTTRLKWPKPVASPGLGAKAAAAAAGPPLLALVEGVGAVAAAGRVSTSPSSGGPSSSSRKLPGFKSVWNKARFSRFSREGIARAC